MISKLFVSILLVIYCLLLFPFFSNEVKNRLLPKQVVMKWAGLYGVDMDEASDLTTLKFREGMTKRDWAARYDGIIKSIEYKHLGGDIVAELTKENKSMIVMHARIMTIAGGVNQIEIYELIKTDGAWLINNITVKEESEFGKSKLDREI